MEQIPDETDTIAAKRSQRLAEKLKKAGERIRKTEAWWNSSYFEFFLLILVLVINLYSVSSYFGTATFYDTFYSGPVIPLLAKLLEMTGVSLGYGFQLINLVFFLLFPIPFYYLVKAIMGRKIIALLSILLISLPFYPFASVRIYSSLVGVDGAHISSLTVSVIALYWIFKFIRDGGSKNLSLASIFSALVALISPFGFSTYLIMALILTFSEMLLGLGRVKLFRFLAIMFFSACLVAFWYNPHFSFWMLTGSLGEEVRRVIFKLLPISFFAIPALGAFGYLLFDRKPSLQPVFLASFYTIAFAMISLVGGGVFPSHPSRYVAELGIGLALLVSVILIKIAESLSIFENNKFYFRFGIVVLLIGMSLVIILGNSNVSYSSQVLGIWTGVEKGTIWQERDRFGGVSSIIGFIISFVAITSLSYINIKTKNSSAELTS